MLLSFATPATATVTTKNCTDAGNDGSSRNDSVKTNAPTFGAMYMEAKATLLALSRVRGREYALCQFNLYSWQTRKIKTDNYCCVFGDMNTAVAATTNFRSLELVCGIQG